MSDPEHADPSPPPPAEADEPALQDEVDQLLDEVESLTKETLGESESGEGRRAPADVPTTDPAKEIVADDVGLSSESPLLQDGARTPVEEVAADVDQELDQMERLISGIGGATPPADSGSSDHSGAAAEIPTDAPDPGPPTDSEIATEPDIDVIGTVEEEKPAPEPAVDAGPAPMPPASADCGDSSLDEDIAEIVAATLDADPQTEPDELIADQIPANSEDLLHSDSEGLQTAESEKETTLDHDLDALLASSEVAALEAPSANVPSPADPLDQPAKTASAAPKQRETPQTEIDLESISIWGLIKLKLKARSLHLGRFIGRRAADTLVRLLERIDAKIGDRMSPMARELVGYCALATFAMSIIALIIFLL